METKTTVLQAEEKLKVVILAPEWKGKISSLKSVTIPEDTEELDCSGLDLESLEGCPPSVKILHASHNKLKGFDQFYPQGLLKADLSHNLFETLERCPPQLQHLRISNNPLSSLKGCSEEMLSLGVSFTHLQDFVGCGPRVTDITAVQCCIVSFRGLPQGHKLNKLYASMNRLNTWEYCPIVLNLDLAGNRFVSMKGCPEGVLELCMSNNRLTTTACCPSSLLKLRLAGNHITQLTMDLPKGLQVLKINDNELTVLDQRVLPSTLQSLFLQGNPLVLFRLDAHVFPQLTTIMKDEQDQKTWVENENEDEKEEDRAQS